MNLVSLLIPRWAIFGVIAAALLGIYAWHAHAVHTARAEGMAEVRGEFNEYITARVRASAAAERAQRSKETLHAKELLEERAQRATDRAVADAAAAGARSQLQRLRATIAAAITTRPVQPGANSGPRPDPDAAAIAAGDVLSECAGEVVEMGEQAEDLAIRLRGLQAWARSAVRVCGPQPDTEILEESER